MIPAGTTTSAAPPAFAAPLAPLPPPLSDTGWGSVRDANIRPYHEWRPPQPVALPVLTVRPGSNVGPGSQSHSFHNGGGSNKVTMAAGSTTGATPTATPTTTAGRDIAPRGNRCRAARVSGDAGGAGIGIAIGPTATTTSPINSATANADRAFPASTIRAATRARCGKLPQLDLKVGWLLSQSTKRRIPSSIETCGA